MTAQYALLGLLESGPRHGYELKRAYDTWFNDVRPIRYSQVYATLARCERDGLVRLAGEEPGRGPDRKRYAITDDGAATLDQWLRQPEAPQPPTQGALFLKIVLSMLSQRPTRDLVEAQRHRHLDRMRELIDAKAEATEPETSVLDYLLFHIEADLRWLDHTAERLARTPSRSDG